MEPEIVLDANGNVNAFNQSGSDRSKEKILYNTKLI